MVVVNVVTHLPRTFKRRFITHLGGLDNNNLLVFVLRVIVLLFMVYTTVLVMRNAEEVPMRCTGHIINNRRCNNTHRCVPLGVFTTGMVPVVFTRTLVFVPVAVVKFASISRTAPFVRVLISRADILCGIVFTVLVVTFACFCATVALGPARVTRSVGHGGNFVPNIGPKGTATRCVSRVVSHVALPNSLTLTLVTYVPTFTKLLGMGTRFTRFFKNASLLVLINIILSALRRVRDRLLVQRCSNLLDSNQVRNHSTCWILSCVVFLGARSRVRLVHTTGQLIKTALTRVTGGIHPKIAAGRLSGITRRCVESRKTRPAFGNFPGPCNSPFPTSVYTSIGSRIIRKVPNSEMLIRKSVISISYNALLSNFGKSSYCAFYMNRITSRIGRLLGIAGRSLCLKVRTTLANGHVNSVNFTIRRRYRSRNCKIIERFIKRNVNGRVRRSPTIPGCKGHKGNALVGGNLYVTVRPVVAVKDPGVNVVPSG